MSKKADNKALCEFFRNTSLGLVKVGSSGLIVSGLAAIIFLYLSRYAELRQW